MADGRHLQADGTYAQDVWGTFRLDPTQPNNFGLISGTVILLPSENNIGLMGGHTEVLSVEITLGASGVSYGANTIMLPVGGGLTEVQNVARVVNGSGYVVGVRASVNKKSVVPAFRIHLFNASNPTLALNAASWKELYADAGKRIAYWDLPAMVTAADITNSDMSRSFDFTQRIPYKCVGNTASIWVGLETLTAWVADASQKITVKLNVEQN